MIHMDTIIGASSVKGRIKSIYPFMRFLTLVKVMFFLLQLTILSLFEYKACLTVVIKSKKIGKKVIFILK